MANVEQTQKMIPLITRETSFGQNVCELVFGVDVFDLDFGVQINSIEQPIKRNSVGSWHVSHRWTSALNDHFDHCLIVFKDVQLRLALRRMCVGGYVVHTWQSIGISVAPSSVSVSRDWASWCVGLGFITRQFPGTNLIGLLVLFVERNTTITVDSK